MFRVDGKWWRCSGTSVQPSAHSGRQQVTMSRSQPVETEATAGSAAAASGIGKLLEISKRLLLYIAQDYDTLLKSTSESCRQGEHIRAYLRKHHQSRRRTFLPLFPDAFVMCT